MPDLTPQDRARQQVEKILLNYNLKQMLDLFPNEAIEKMAQEQLIPLQIETLAEAKAEVYKRTGFLPEMMGISDADQKQLWYWLQEFIKDLK
jgi:hypothetical protein